MLMASNTPFVYVFFFFFLLIAQGKMDSNPNYNSQRTELRTKEITAVHKIAEVRKHILCTFPPPTD